MTHLEIVYCLNDLLLRRFYDVVEVGPDPEVEGAFPTVRSRLYFCDDYLLEASVVLLLVPGAARVGVAKTSVQ